MLRITKREFVIISLIIIASIALVFVIPKSLSIPYISDILVVSTVLFAIFCGFFLAATLTNYSRLQSLVASETGDLISLYDLCRHLNPSIKKEIGDAIDNYLISSYDFEMAEYIDKTWGEFGKILEVIEKIPRSDSQIFTYLMQIKSDLLKVRQEFSLVSRKLIGVTNWIILIILTILNILVVYSIRGPSVISNVIAVIFSISFLLILFLLNEVDSNRFAEEKMAFYIYQRVFKEMGKMPYYPEYSIKKWRVNLPDEPYRVGIYKNPGRSFDKKIKIIHP